MWMISVALFEKETNVAVSACTRKQGMVISMPVTEKQHGGNDG